MRVVVFWPKMAQDVQRHCKRCDSCQRNKAAIATPRPPAAVIEYPQRPWQSFAIDFMDLPMSTRGHNAVLIVTCRFSSQVHIIPTQRTVTADESADLLLVNVVRLHGVPDSIVSDRDTRFTSEL